MKTKNIINILLLCFTCNLVPAQELVYDMIPAGKSVVCSLGETDACVTIIADKSLELGFRSSNEKLIDFMSNKENIGSQTHYYLHFKTTMPHNMNRKLEIFTKTNPNPIIIELEYLMPKQTLIFSVKAIPCYDPVFREGNKFFLAGQYQAARAEYVKAQSCFDVPPPSENELEKLLVQIDSIEAWIKIANESMLLLDYNTALTYYQKVISLNSFDQQTRKKRDAAIDKQSTHCKKCAKAAYRHYKEHEYEKALELSQLIVTQGCNDKQYYDTLIVKIHRIIEARKNKYRVFSYEFGISNFKNPNIILPISFSIGKYLDHKMGGYFSFCTNPAFFNMLRSNYSKAVHADIGISFGLNFRPIKPKVTQYAPLWLHLGTGYTLMGAYHYKNISGEEMRYESGELPDSKLKLMPYHVIPFEAGVLVKIIRVAIRYTFQYRFAIDLETQKYVNPFMHNFGIGICF